MKLLIVVGCAALGGYAMGPIGALIWGALGFGLTLWIPGENRADQRIKEMRRSLGYDADDEAAGEYDHEVDQSISSLAVLDELANLLKVPPEVFALNIPLNDTLNTWTPEEIVVLKGKVSNFLRSDISPEFSGALEHLLRRLVPLSPDSTHEFDPDAFKQAILKMYEDK
ncbi:MAG: hypothetical protein HY941_12415 [Gammaproteobacteria bacterium]|nr:hypothetical protein [Gammaproteobacteria bacterium]